MKLGEIAASSTQTLTLEYLPPYIMVVASTVPTQIKVNVTGYDIITDLDGAGITELQGLNAPGLPTNLYKIPLADGLVPGVNVDITIANAVAAALPVYGSRMYRGRALIKTTQVPVLASQSFEEEDFAFLLMPSLSSANDELYVTFRDRVTRNAAGKVLSSQKGLRDRLTPEEIEMILGEQQSNVNGIIALNNLDQRYGKIVATVAAAQTFYKIKYIPL